MRKKEKKSNANTMVKLITDAPNWSIINIFILPALKSMNFLEKIARSLKSIIISNIGRKYKNSPINYKVVGESLTHAHTPFLSLSAPPPLHAQFYLKNPQPLKD